jgi:hypothetical protein
MCLLSELEALTGCSATWKESATPAGRSWWVLVMSERRTDATGCGSSDDFPTPMASDGRAKGVGGKRKTPSLLHLSQTWPTATAGDANSSGSRNLPGSNAHPGTSLTDKARECWPTPDKMAGHRAGKATTYEGYQEHKAKHAARGVNAQFHLNAAVDGAETGTWPTAQDAKNDTLPPSQMNRDSVPGAMLRDGPPDPASSSTNGKSRDSCNWPTARGQDSYERRNMNTIVKVNEEGGDLTLPSKVIYTQGRGVLNSRWVLTLLGYPSDWCDGGIETP